MEPRERGYFELCVRDIPAGTRYSFRIDGERDRPDPASRFQPDGVHGSSAVMDPSFPWSDSEWHGIPLREYIVYELHVGVFSSRGDFEGLIQRLDELADLGITAIELMPVAQFPGTRNWGYDGVHPYAVQNSYGGPDGLRRLVNAAHARGLAVVLDVVCNHLGPEGNYLGEFGPYFTSRYQTPWGAAVNFDGPGSDEVRRFFIECCLHWVRGCHIDALRLDAIHAIYDVSARPFLQELASAVRREGERLHRHVHTIAETSRNDSRLLRPAEMGGCGIDAQWCDDFHHALRTALTADHSGYYRDYRGFADIVKALQDGYVLDGRYSDFHGRRHGNSIRDLPPERLFVFAQNHDQVGNRLLGERLSEHLSFEQLKLAAGLVLLSPYQPLLFMGEEYGETARFTYFVSHGDPDLVAAVRRGRKEEFAGFEGNQEPADPQDEATFLRCKLNHHLKEQGNHRLLLAFYRHLIRLRKNEPSLFNASRAAMEVSVLEPGRILALLRCSAGPDVLAVFHFGDEPASATAAPGEGWWDLLLDSAHSDWGGSGSSLPARAECRGDLFLPLAPCSVALYRKGE